MRASVMAVSFSLLLPQKGDFANSLTVSKWEEIIYVGYTLMEALKRNKYLVQNGALSVLGCDDSYMMWKGAGQEAAWSILLSDNRKVA